MSTPVTTEFNAFNGFIHPKKKRKTLSFHDGEEEDLDSIPIVENKPIVPKIIEKPTVKSRDPQKLLQGMKICIAGRLTRSRQQYEEEIKRLGGELTKNVTKDISFFITASDRHAQNNVLTRKAYEIGLVVVNEKYWIDVTDQNQILDPTPYRITQAFHDGVSEESDEVSDEDERGDIKQKKGSKKKDDVIQRPNEKKKEKTRAEDELAEIEHKIKRREKLIQDGLSIEFAKLVSREPFKFADAIFNVHGEMIYSSRMVLSVRSKYFADLFEGGDRSTHLPIVIKHPVSASIFFNTLTWLVSGKWDATGGTESFLKIGAFAETLGLMDLKDIAMMSLEVRVKDIIAHNLVTEALKTYDMILNSSEMSVSPLTHLIQEYCFAKLAYLIHDPSFYNLSIKAITEIVTSMNLNVEESVLFEKLCNWAGCKIADRFPARPVFMNSNEIQKGMDMTSVIPMVPKAIRSFLADCLPFILFEHMNSDAILTKVEGSKMFTEKEIVEMSKATLTSSLQSYTILGKEYSQRRKRRGYNSKHVKNAMVYQYTLSKKDIYNRVDFTPIDLFGLEWFFSTQGEYGNYLGVYLYNKLICTGGVLTTPISTHVTIRLRNKNREKPKSGTFMTEWNNRKAWGFSNFIEKKSLFDSENGWIDEKGNLTFEVSIEKR